MRPEDLTDPRDKKHAEREESRHRAATYSDSHQKAQDDYNRFPEPYYGTPQICKGCNRKISYWRTYCRSCEPP